MHGAWADASSWDGVAAILLRDGYTVDVAPNPLRGLTYDSDYLKDYLAGITGPIVLVGHSYGGAVITDAATGNNHVKALVYDDAYIPALGENVTTLSSAQSALAPAATNPATVLNLVNYPDPPTAGIVDTYLLKSVVAKDFAPDVSAAEQALLFATQSPTSLAALAQPSTAPAWKTVPSWDVVGRQDKIIPEAAQLMMAHRTALTSPRSTHPTSRSSRTPPRSPPSSSRRFARLANRQPRAGTASSRPCPLSAYRTAHPVRMRAGASLPRSLAASATVSETRPTRLAVIPL